MNVRRVSAALALALGAWPAAAVEPREWTADAAELLRGRADGIAVSAAGKLFLAPRMQRLEGVLDRSTALETWSACGGGRGVMFFGTGPDGVVVRADGNGRGTEFFRTGEPMVTALHRLAGGDLLAATSPGGRIYRIDAAGHGRLWSETGQNYVWAIAETDGGNVFVACGDRGRVLRVRDDGSTAEHFASDEAHIVSLVHDGGTLFAGGGGSGRVYAIDMDGNALVLYDDELDEARAIVREGPDRWIVALVGAPSREASRPALRLRLPDGTPVGSVEPNLAIEDRPGPTLRGFIEGLDHEAAPPPPLRGRLVRLDAAGAATTLWESTTETPLSLATDADGRVVLGTGEPARLYRIERDEVALIGTLREAHATALLRDERTLFAATSNPAALWRVESIDAEQGAFLSPAFDAGAPARWGSIAWTSSGRLARTEVYTRTGNSALPDATWSAWGPAQVLADGSPLDNPDGRFAQFRVRFVGTQEPAARLGDVTLVYETHNRPPSLDAGDAAPLRAVSGAAGFDWKASDPDGDALELVLEYRTAFGTDWTVGAGGGTIQAGSGTLEWDTVNLAEGLYDTRLAADDGAANDPAEGHRVYGPLRRVRVDRSAPTIEVRGLPGGRVEVVVADEATRVARLTLLRDGQPAGRVRASDGVCDSRRERFEFDLPAEPARWTVRGTDLAGNTVEAGLPE